MVAPCQKGGITSNGTRVEGGARVTADVTKAEALEVARRKRHGNRPQQLTVVHFLEHFHGYPFDERRYPLGLT